MTSEEAESKWCPMAGNQRQGRQDEQCIASACMAWRREKDTYADDYGKDIPDNLGYCGLAGRP